MPQKGLPLPMSSASRWRAGSTVGRMAVTTSASNCWLMAATHLNTWLRWKQTSKPLQSCLQRALQLLANHATGRSPLAFTLRAINLLSVSAWCLIFTAQPNDSSLPSLSPVSLKSFLSKQGQLAHVLCIPRSLVRNKLPQNVWRASSVNSFKTALKTDLFHH